MDLHLPKKLYVSNLQKKFPTLFKKDLPVSIETPESTLNTKEHDNEHKSIEEYSITPKKRIKSYDIDEPHEKRSNHGLESYHCHPFHSASKSTVSNAVPWRHGSLSEEEHHGMFLNNSTLSASADFTHTKNDQAKTLDVRKRKHLHLDDMEYDFKVFDNDYHSIKCDQGSMKKMHYGTGNIVNCQSIQPKANEKVTDVSKGVLNDMSTKWSVLSHHHPNFYSKGSLYNQQISPNSHAGKFFEVIDASNFGFSKQIEEHHSSFHVSKLKDCTLSGNTSAPSNEASDASSNNRFNKKDIAYFRDHAPIRGYNDNISSLKCYKDFCDSVIISDDNLHLTSFKKRDPQQNAQTVVSSFQNAPVQNAFEATSDKNINYLHNVPHQNSDMPFKGRHPSAFDLSIRHHGNELRSAQEKRSVSTCKSSEIDLCTVGNIRSKKDASIQKKNQTKVDENVQFSNISEDISVFSALGIPEISNCKSNLGIPDPDLQIYFDKIREGAMALKQLTKIQSERMVLSDDILFEKSFGTGEVSSESINYGINPLRSHGSASHDLQLDFQEFGTCSSADVMHAPQSNVSSTSSFPNDNRSGISQNNPSKNYKEQMFEKWSNPNSNFLNKVSKNVLEQSQSQSVSSTVQVKCDAKNPSQSETCRVCTDVASGFHFGAFICEACKKFFLRCLKHGNMKYVCSKSQDCKITKESRTQCQFCRYQKCFKVGMHKPGAGPDLGKDADISNIPCKVCGARSSGYHFGAITCEGCKGFFRRTIKERDSLRYTCNKESNCSITTTTRNVCKFCRYQKCLQAGMTPEGSRIGRQPNAIKHATFLEIKQLSTNHSLPKEAETVKLGDHLNESAEAKTSPKQAIGKTAENEYSQVVILDAWKNMIEELLMYKDSSSTLMMETDDAASTWDKMMESFYVKSRTVLKFAKSLPGFSTFPIQHQISMIQVSMYQIILLIQTQLQQYKQVQCTWFLFPKKDENHIMKRFPEMAELKKHYSAIVQSTVNMHLDETEIALLATMILLSRDDASFREVYNILQYQEDVAMMLQMHCTEKYPTEIIRFGTVVMRLPELLKSNHEHSKIMHQIVKNYNIKIPQLFFEVFLNHERVR